MKKEEQGSILIVVIIVSLLLSIAIMTGLSMSNDEMKATDQYYIKKATFYNTNAGLEDVRSEIYRDPSLNAVQGITREKNGTIDGNENKGKTISITGTLEDLDKYLNGSGAVSHVKPFNGFVAPPMPGMSLGTGTTVTPVIWNVTISSVTKKAKRQAFCEINAGVYSLMTTGY